MPEGGTSARAGWLRGDENALRAPGSRHDRLGEDGLGDERPGTIAYVAASGDIAGSLRSWRDGKDVGHEASRAYSAGLFDVFSRMGSTARCYSPSPTPDQAGDGRIEAANIAPMRRSRGLGHYWAWLCFSLGVIRRLWSIRPDVLIISDRVIAFPLLGLLRLRGTRIVHVLHIALGNNMLPRSLAQRVMLALELRCMRSFADAVFALPGPALSHVRAALAGSPVAVASFLPEWDIARFARMGRPDFAASPFEISYIGRVEREKGVFDLLDAFAVTRALCPRPLRLNFVGTGSAIEPLRAAIVEKGLADVVVLHGQASGHAVDAIMARSHVIVAPTRSQFGEGLNKVVVEGVLSGRPVVASYACPAAFLSPGSVITTEVDDAPCLTRALLRLATDEQVYACAADHRTAMRAELERLGHPLWRRIEAYLRARAP